MRKRLLLGCALLSPLLLWRPDAAPQQQGGALRGHELEPRRGSGSPADARDARPRGQKLPSGLTEPPGALRVASPLAGRGGAAGAGGAPLAALPRELLPVGMREWDEEDEAMWGGDSRPELRTWRQSWSLEDDDPGWTQAVRAQLGEKAASLIGGSLEVEEVSCRETVCRLFLVFASAGDAMDVVDSEHVGAERHGYHALVVGSDDGPHLYEVLLVRERPRDLVTHARVEAAAERDGVVFASSWPP